jgi:lambda repressor-like predicted transcriptional regulator
VKTCAVDQVELGMALLRPARLTPADFKGLIRQRGWQMADAAARWAIQPETLSRVASDPERETR